MLSRRNKSDHHGDTEHGERQELSFLAQPRNNFEFLENLFLLRGESAVLYALDEDEADPPGRTSPDNPSSAMRRREGDSTSKVLHEADH
jgi:hypothetical protein